MLRNYILIAFRKIFSNWIESSINIIGLVIGIASALLIFSYVSHEMHYDSFHKDSERIFKAGGTISYGSNEFNLFGFAPGFGEQLIESDARVESISRYYKMPKSEVTANDKTFFENEFCFVDDHFLQMFNFPLISGNAQDLTSPSKVFLSKAAALKYFASVDVIGKTMVLNHETEMVITGVFEDTPSNSTLDFEFIASAATLGLIEEMKEQWQNRKFQLGNFQTFLKLDYPESQQLVEATMASLNEDISTSYRLYPIKDIYLNFGDQADDPRANLMIFIAIGVMILLLAVINYINLTIARSTSRYKEIGVRKVNGASKTSLSLQFFLESAIYVLVAFFLGALAAYFLKPSLTLFLGITLDNSFLINSAFLTTVTLMVGSLILVTGIYPALVMGRQLSVDILKGQSNTKSKGSSWLQKIFTGLQFGASVAMIFCTVVVWQQLSHLRSEELGIKKDQVMVLSTPGSSDQPMAYLKNELKSIAGVENVASSSLSMFNGGYSIFFVPIPERKDNGVSINYMTIDENFVDLLGLNWAAKPEISLNNGDFILNEAAVNKLNLKEDPRGDELRIGGKGNISGVVDNFIYSPLSTEVGPLAMRIRDDLSEAQGSYNNFIYLKINKGSNLKNIISQIELKMSTFQTDSPMEYYFLDDAFNNLFQSQERLSYLLSIFSIIAIGVACLGLLGLITFSLERRVKEIGIRKVVGAQPIQLVRLFTASYTWIFLISACLAVPLAWLAMESWLSQFTSQIELRLVYALFAAIILIFLGFLVVGIRSFIASTAKVIDSLRNE